MTLFSIQKGCIASSIHTLNWLLSLHAFALKGAMSFLHLFHFADADATLVGEILGVQKQVTH
jgi:hypothetical protein